MHTVKIRRVIKRDLTISEPERAEIHQALVEGVEDWESIVAAIIEHGPYMSPRFCFDDHRVKGRDSCSLCSLSGDDDCQDCILAIVGERCTDDFSLFGCTETLDGAQAIKNASGLLKLLKYLETKYRKVDDA